MIAIHPAESVSKKKTNKLQRNGFTLIELMVTISVLAVLATIAAPNFSHFITSNRLTGQVNELVANLTLARNEAATRGRRVQVCIASSATTGTGARTCASSGADWAAGYIVWSDLNGNGSLDTNEIIRQIDPLDGQVTFIASGPTATNTLSFLPAGNLAVATAWTFKLCAPNNPNGRQVTLPVSGRAKASRISNC